MKLAKIGLVFALITIFIESIILVVLHKNVSELDSKIGKLERQQVTQSGLMFASSIFVNHSEIVNASILGNTSEAAISFRENALPLMYGQSIKLAFGAAKNIEFTSLSFLLAAIDSYDIDGLTLPDEWDSELTNLLEYSNIVASSIEEKSIQIKKARYEVNKGLSVLKMESLESIDLRAVEIHKLKSKRKRTDRMIFVTLFFAVSFQLLTVIAIFIKESDNSNGT